tara:strand:- start:721 stop:945 length:225 start_codon:yes stop_codon:yes gene_type:complete
MNLAKNHMISIRKYNGTKDVLLKNENQWISKGVRGFLRPACLKKGIVPILSKASSLPSGWNLAGSTTALKLLTI